MTYEELKKAYEESQKRCSKLGKKIEEKDLFIENPEVEMTNNLPAE